MTDSSLANENSEQEADSSDNSEGDDGDGADVHTNLIFLQRPTRSGRNIRINTRFNLFVCLLIVIITE